VPIGQLRRSSNPLRTLNAQSLRDLGRVPKGIVEARAIAADYKVGVILSTGGYVAVPVGLAARVTKTKLVVHEQTARLGPANRILVRSAKPSDSCESTLKLLPDQVAASAVVTGNPVRPAVFTGAESKGVAALGMVGYAEGLPTVYVTGGAQGSESDQRHGAREPSVAVDGGQRGAPARRGHEFLS
jgi:UDP-N-acetylglucosamine--N-acetylmuramyl-(pentapeptide) pyrophosphoryl-undecaprenol N-acetylglucosamine transferase